VKDDSDVVPFAGSKLARLLESSEISARRFARFLLSARGERTIRRWQLNGVPREVEEWASQDVVRLVRRGNMHVQRFVPIDPKSDRRAVAPYDEGQRLDVIGIAEAFPVQTPRLWSAFGPRSVAEKCGNRS